MRYETFENATPVDITEFIPVPKPATTPKPGPFSKVYHTVERWIEAFVQRQRKIREHRELSELSDRLLKDIGVHRRDLKYAKFKSLIKDPI